MSIIQQETVFAPAERATKEDLAGQVKVIKDLSIMRIILDAVPLPFVILNNNRQIVFTNQHFLTFISKIDEDAVVGLRVGEALNCARSQIMAGGCGTSEYCSVCGAVSAILTAQSGKKDVQECLITKQNGESLELKVWTEPFICGGINFTLVAAADISSEKRRRVLERIFFHDILNDAGCLRGYTELLQGSDPSEMKEYADVIYDMSDILIEDIISQQELSAAENDELKVKLETLNLKPILQDIIDNYKKHQVSECKNLFVSDKTEDIQIHTDKKMLRRVIGNLVKNALEAIQPQQKVMLNAAIEQDKIVISVTNDGFMARNIQLQIFQRSFTTKGEGRGLGTYSIKLFTEKYLKGEVGFESSPETGTVFKITIPQSIEK
ncbi:MAG: HAMP domain-containing histidine kinase [Firmicutes bacterium]|nr:HAMP domain-containing histidine kinase [Bacillota bacterium]